MSSTIEKPNENEQPVMHEDQNANRKIYQKPYLEELGDLRTVTLGTSPGLGDSLDPGNLKL